jgi:alginate O-acetyltransferase complex protein AlgI
MAAFCPKEPSTAWLIGLLWLGILAAGFAITRLGATWLARLAAWLLVVVSLTAALVLTAHEPAGVRMAAICLSLLSSMKAVVAVESQAAGQPGLSFLRWFAFAALSVGMRPTLFAKAGRSPLRGAGELIARGIERLVMGIACLLVVPIFWRELASWASSWALAGATILGLVGLSLTMHFGLFNIVAGLWRLAGMDCRALFRSPLLAGSLTEFWGRRWNLAFSGMAALAVARPLAGILGPGGAVLAAFLFSGVLHELAISVPVRAGYSGPFLYFVLHGVLVLLERVLAQRGRPIERLGWLGRVWTLVWLGLPLPILFNPPFIRGVIWPILGIMQGSLPVSSLP